MDDEPLHNPCLACRRPIPRRWRNGKLEETSEWLARCFCGEQCRYRHVSQDRDDGGREYLPTPAEIAAACREIRRSWEDGLQKAMD